MHHPSLLGRSAESAARRALALAVGAGLWACGTAVAPSHYGGTGSPDTDAAVTPDVQATGDAANGTDDDAAVMPDGAEDVSTLADLDPLDGPFPFDVLTDAPPDGGGGPGSCCSIGDSPGCADTAIEACVCAQDPYCCESQWDDPCVAGVAQWSCGSCDGADASGDAGGGDAGPTDGSVSDVVADVGAPPQCSAGECCTAQGTFAAQGSPCGPSPVATKTSCAGSAQLATQQGFGVCTGASPDCDTAPASLQWGAAVPTVCPSGLPCLDEPGENDTCGCTAGACCEVATKTISPATKACGVPKPATWTCDGYKMQTCAKVALCDGKGKECPADAVAKKITQCAWAECDKAKNEHCVKEGGKPSTTASPATPASCVVLPAGNCYSGACCAWPPFSSDAAKLDPQGAKCGNGGQPGNKCVGDKLEVRTNTYSCNGVDPQCNVVLEKKLVTCEPGTLCQPNPPSSDACVPVCSPGACCDSATGKYRGKDAQCGPATFSSCACWGGSAFTDFFCTAKYQGCSGVSSDCPTDNLITYQNYDVKVKCKWNETCAVNGGSFSCVPKAPACSSGPCCDAATGKPKPVGTKCGGQLGEKFVCTSNYPMHAAIWAGCNGSSSACSPDLADAVADPLVAYGPQCTMASPCVASATSATCGGAPVTCTGGACCDPATQKVRPSGTVCGNVFGGALYDCVNGDIYTQDKSFVCDGQAPTCSTDLKKAVSNPWKVYKDCGSAQCEISGTTIQCATSIPGTTKGCGALCSAASECTNKSCVGGKCLPGPCDGCFKSGQECSYSAKTCGFANCVAATGFVMQPIATPASHKNNPTDVCASWQVVNTPARFSACSYTPGGSGYTVYENQGAKTAAACWTTFFNLPGKASEYGCYNQSPPGSVTKSSCFSCGTQNGGAKSIELNKYVPL